MSQTAQSYRCNNPVAFLVFNRPETTRRVFQEITKVKPRTLLIVADGPRPNRPDDVEHCEAVRKIFEGIDWDCEVLTNYSHENLGCARRVSSGIDWVFQNVEEAIFLEDDCLPHQSFFRFCDEMLRIYRDDERIMSITGDNFQFGRRRWEYSYYFSRYVHVWGWATWRRAWKYYDLHISNWPMVSAQGWLYDILGDRREAEFWKDVFDRVHAGESGTWDYQWVFACWLRSALSIVPNMNLISNIGFGKNATHTGGTSKVANMAIEEMDFPLTHPPILIRDSRADRATARLFFHKSPLSQSRALISRLAGKRAI
jgi:hypothetical protein